MNRKSPHTILVIDDDTLFCDAISQHLAGDDRRIFVAHSGTEGLRICKNEQIDIIVLDQKLPDGKGIDFCHDLIELNDQTKIIFGTAYPSVDDAIAAMKIGAYDYLSKPFKMVELELIIEKALKTITLERIEQVQTYRNRQEQEATILIGSDGGMREVDRLAELAAASDASVLITGETGTGKNQVARSIHFRSPRNKAALISINCAALPENLIEAELFGYEKGAFTGAHSTKKGIFEMAQGGTLFLDEIGELPIHLQSKLLGVLDEQKIKRLGAQSAKHVNVRVVAATNADLDTAVHQKQFRQDLFFRLSVLRIHIPPLHKRPNDIPTLCRYFIQKIEPGLDLEIPASEQNRMMHYRWPGNVRELRNILERAIILRRSGRLRPSDLLQKKIGPPETMHNPEHQPNQALQQSLLKNNDLISLREMEERHIRHALKVMAHNHTHAAEALGISRSTLIRKIKQYGLA